MITSVNDCPAYRGTTEDRTAMDVEKIMNGSTFYEIDTGSVYMFNGETKE
ncbi:MAG: hypothetical protein J6W64_04050 [Bacilli bacterium]|nr:hypothetical protein [Bacilli bacterium]